MAAEKITFPLKPWQKACLNGLIVAGITSLSMISTGDMNNPHLWHSAMIAGTLTLLMQMNQLISGDLKEADEGECYSPLMFIK